MRLVFLVEIFDETHTRDSMLEVMKIGHVGAEYVEYVLRHKKRLVPAPPPLRLGDPELDDISFREPDLSTYDEASPAVRRRSTPGSRDDEEG